VTRFIVAVVAIFLGVWLIYVGRINVETQASEESGSRRRVNTALGRSNTYTGGTAVLQGWIRIALGVAAIVFGIVYAILGAEG